ncbi:phosphotransferase [Alicyclobacillus acidoterrestris]|uniref:Phosphotransferase n=1 Tax=Alicyclobacillus acidoterrestris (strain ATCC 49025 / DSM 3922 / CIP 106132 / NCIMB 13137 / GD3B) TaxID=1356854 RepID=T0BPN5_ALIAG|nr:phosphotransferase [Alicyclobacillus acidoterrestris]EPZ42729.1 hypothetical protein N007_14355 [Alicyclobacillus acidoterrestris ATCC 49025]UNO50112.1 phosphotransferase [Alicyclobacillus acidoterrestris]
MTLFSEIEQAYGMQIESWQAIKDVYRVRTNAHGILCVKPYRIPMEEVSFILAVQEHVRNHNFQFVPATFRTAEGHLAIRYHHRFYVLSRWIVGGNPAFRRARALADGIETLARFHSVSHGFDESVPPSRMRALRIKETFSRQKRILKRIDGDWSRSDFTNLCARAIRQLDDRRVQRAIEREVQARAVIHGDYNYPNLVVDRLGRYHLIDFDNASVHVRMEDLAHVLHRNAPWQVHQMSRLIEVYDRVRPLAQDDLHLLVALLLQPYPLIRALRAGRSIHAIQSRLPGTSLVKRYVRQLEQLV